LSGFLLDTNVISASSPIHHETNEAFGRWLREQVKLDTLFLSVVTIHEISRGIALLRHRGATAKAERLVTWLDIVKSDFSDRLVCFDETTASLAGELEAVAISAGFEPGMADAMIAATAKLHDLKLVTKNLRHFHMFGIDVVSPTDVAA